MDFEVARRTDAYFCIAIEGPGGSGKSMTAYWLAEELANGGDVGAIDSERHRARLYARNDGEPPSTIEQKIAGEGRWRLRVQQVEEGSPQEYIEAIDKAARAGIKVLVIDTFSRSWMGALDIVDKMGGWVRAGKTVTPLLKRLVDKILSYPGHVICTFRVDDENVIVTDEKGKVKIEKLGTKTVARKGIEYEFMFWFSARPGGMFEVLTTRTGRLPHESMFSRTDVPKVAATLKDWIGSAAPETPPEHWARRFRFAADLAQLEAAMGELIDKSKAGVPGAVLPKGEKQTLMDVYTRRKQELTEADSGSAPP